MEGRTLIPTGVALVAVIIITVILFALKFKGVI